MQPQLHRLQCCAYKVLQNPSADMDQKAIEDFVAKARTESGHDNVHRGFTTIVTYTTENGPIVKNLKKIGFVEMEAKGDLGDLCLWALDVQNIHPLNGRRY